MPIWSPAPATLTVGDLIDRTFDLLLGSTREERNRLTAPTDDVQTVIPVSYDLGSLKRGTYLAVDDEVMYVWSTTSSSMGSSTITVERGDKGTTAVPHGAGSILAVNPYFTKYMVRRTVQDEIRSWGPQVFQIKSTDISATEFVRGYDMGALGDWFFVISVTESPDLMSASKTDNSWGEVSYKIQRDTNTTAFPSGNALIITDPLGVFDVPRVFHVAYAAPIDVDATFNDADPVTPMGLQSSELDIPPYGAAWRLAASREVRRMITEAQGENTDLTNFPPGYQLKAAEGFKTLRDSRLQDAISRLRSQYPIRRMS